MNNADRIKDVAKQMIGVCNVIINLSEAEESELYDEMLWDELSHAQKLVLEFTRYAFDEGTEPDGAVEAEPVPITDDNFDEAFFEGELDDKKETEDKGVVVDFEEEEDDKDIVPKSIDK